MSINFDGPECNCGSRGCLESYVSTWAVEKRIKALALMRGGSWKAIYNATGGAVKGLFDAARDGDREAIELADEVGRYPDLVLRVWRMHSLHRWGTWRWDIAGRRDTVFCCKKGISRESSLAAQGCGSDSPGQARGVFGGCWRGCIGVAKRLRCIKRLGYPDNRLPGDFVSKR